jgi:hypothetical protein
MKKTLAVTLGFCLLLLLVALPSQANSNDLGYIIPYHHYGETIVVEEGEEVIIAFRRGTCIKGLARAFSQNTASIFMEVTKDAQPYLTVGPHARKYWAMPEILDWPDFPMEAASQYAQENCGPPKDYLWSVMWFYSLGELDPGVYEVYSEYSWTHPVHDGFDRDGDGVRDKMVFEEDFPPPGTFTIIVLAD